MERTIRCVRMPRGPGSSDADTTPDHPSQAAIVPAASGRGETRAVARPWPARFHPRGTRPVLGNHDELAAFLQETDWDPIALARFAANHLDDDRVSSRVRRARQPVQQRPHTHRVAEFTQPASSSDLAWCWI